MERESNSMQAMCRSGCGFYGNPATDGLCSLCYKEQLKKKQQPPQSSSTTTATATTTSPAASAASAPATTPLVSLMDTTATAQPTVPLPMNKETFKDLLTQGDESSSKNDATEPCSSQLDINDDASDSGKDDKDAKKKKNRCAICRKKVGLTGFECRCNGLFCAVHRYSDKHECKFNYREMGAQEIRRNNPVVVGEKIQKI